jgi:hypothetical protein
VDLAQVQLADAGFYLVHVAHNHPNQMIGQDELFGRVAGLVRVRLERSHTRYNQPYAVSGSSPSTSFFNARPQRVYFFFVELFVELGG